MLEHFLVAQLFAFFMIFCRIGGGIMVLPGFGEAYVPANVRLALAFTIAVLLTPVMGKLMPSVPDSPFTFALLIISETLVGLFIGVFCNILISATNISGMIISYQSGLSSDVIYDVTQSSQGSVVGNFMGLVTIVVLFATNLHHLMLRGIMQSYTVFLPGHFPPVGDFMETVARVIADTFLIAVQISGPVILASLLLFLGSGIIARLMPTIQVFFLIIPPQMLTGMFVFMATFSTVMLWYMEFYRSKLEGFMSYLK